MFVVLETLIIDRGKAEVNSQGRGDKKLAIPEYTVYKYFIIYKYILLVRVICEKYRLRGEAFDCSRSQYFLQITLTNRIYLFNSAEYLTASKTVACKQVQKFRPPRSFNFQLRLKINLRKEKSFQRSDQCINSGTNSKIK
jgi:hypothetical protein